MSPLFVEYIFTRFIAREEKSWDTIIARRALFFSQGFLSLLFLYSILNFFIFFIFITLRCEIQKNATPHRNMTS